MTGSERPMDHVPPDDPVTSDIEKHVTARATWVRLIFMILFGFFYGVSRLVTAVVVIVQFFHVLFTGETNAQLKTFGHSLAVYSYEVVDYLTFNTETRPYPLDAEWPADLPSGGAGPAKSG